VAIDQELCQLDACGQAELVRRGEVSPAELVSQAIARIEAFNPELNAVIAPLFDRAMERAATGPDAPFAGVPLLLKDAGQELADTPHWVGTPVLHRLGHRSPLTTPLVSHFEELGFAVVGKTNVPELSVGASTEPAELGPTRNPWSLEHTAGGSSGGSAAAVAAGLVPIAHGADGTGSLRFPASACGLLTLKPSTGRVASAPAAGMEDPGRVWCDFVLVRSARDLTAAFAHLAGPASVEPTSRRLRVGLLTSDVALGLPAHHGCLAAVERLGAALESLGHRVELVHPPALDGLWSRVAKCFFVLGARARASQLRWLESRVGRSLDPDDLSAEALEQAHRGAAVSLEEAGRAVAQFDAAIEPIAAWWQDHDLLVTPTMREVPWLLGRPQDPSRVGGFAFPYSFTGQPALSLPAHQVDGLPVGVQVVGRKGHDEELLALAAALEPLMGWTERWPPLTPAQCQVVDGRAGLG